ncbi:MAG: acyl-CoA thioesterase [Pararhodobacter sp.]|nr:acyl-CoA thioesterase [Pararhodobacter sp.]
MSGPGAARPASGRAAYRAQRAVVLRQSDGDSLGHLGHLAVLALCHEAVGGWLSENGLLRRAPREAVGHVTESGCKLHADLTCTDALIAGLRVARLGLSSVRYEVALFRDAEDHPAAEAFFVQVHVDAESRRPMPLPAALRAGLGAIQG